MIVLRSTLVWVSLTLMPVQARAQSWPELLLLLANTVPALADEPAASFPVDAQATSARDERISDCERRARNEARKLALDRASAARS